MQLPLLQRILTMILLASCGVAAAEAAAKSATKPGVESEATIGPGAGRSPAQASAPSCLHLPFDYNDPEKLDIEVCYQARSSSAYIEDRPTVMYIQGGPGLTSKFNGLTNSAVHPLNSFLFPRSKADVNVIEFDPRGSGASFHLDLDNLYSFLELKNFLPEAVIQDMSRIHDDYLKRNPRLSQKKLILVAHSYGAQLAYLFALKYPDKVSDLIILNGVSSPYIWAADLIDGEAENQSEAATEEQAVIAENKTIYIQNYNGRPLLRRPMSEPMSYFLNDLMMCKYYLNEANLSGTSFSKNTRIAAYLKPFCISDDLKAGVPLAPIDLSQLQQNVFILNTDTQSKVGSKLIAEDIATLKQRKAMTYVYTEDNSTVVGSTHFVIFNSRQMVAALLRMFVKGETDLTNLDIRSRSPLVDSDWDSQLEIFSEGEAILPATQVGKTE